MAARVQPLLAATTRTAPAAASARTQPCETGHRSDFWPIARPGHLLSFFVPCRFLERQLCASSTLHGPRPMLGLLKRWLGWDTDSGPFDFGDLRPSSRDGPIAPRAPAPAPTASKRPPQKQPP